MTTPAEVTTTTASAEDIAFREAEAAYRRHIDLLNELNMHPRDKKLLARLRETSTGVDYATWKNWYENVWPENGWEWRSGLTVVRSLEPIEILLDQSPPQVTVQACDDASAVLIVDADGDPVRSPDTDPMALGQIIIVQGDDGSWLVSHTIRNKLVTSCE